MRVAVPHARIDHPADVPLVAGPRNRFIATSSVSVAIQVCAGRVVEHRRERQQQFLRQRVLPRPPAKSSARSRRPACSLKLHGTHRFRRGFHTPPGSERQHPGRGRTVRAVVDGDQRGRTLAASGSGSRSLSCGSVGDIVSTSGEFGSWGRRSARTQRARTAPLPWRGRLSARHQFAFVSEVAAERSFA